jgi:hypothetical protein
MNCPAAGKQVKVSRVLDERAGKAISILSRTVLFVNGPSNESRKSNQHVQLL